MITLAQTEIIKINPDQVPLYLFGLLFLLGQILIKKLNNETDNKQRQDKLRLDFDELVKTNLIDNDAFKEQLILKNHEETSKWRDYILKELELKDKRLNDHGARLTDTERDLSIAKQDLALAQQEAQKVPNLTKLINRFEEQIKEVSNQIITLIEENLNLQSESETRKVLITERDTEIARLKFQIRTLTHDLELKAEEVLKKDKMISEFIQEVEELKGKLKKLEKLLEDKEVIENDNTTISTGDSSTAN